MLGEGLVNADGRGLAPPASRNDTMNVAAGVSTRGNAHAVKVRVAERRIKTISPPSHGEKLFNHELTRRHTNSDLATRRNPPSLKSQLPLSLGSYGGTSLRGKQEAQNQRERDLNVVLFVLDKECRPPVNVSTSFGCY